MNEKLDKIYSNPQTGLRGWAQLYSDARKSGLKVSVNEVKDFINAQPTQVYYHPRQAQLQRNLMHKIRAPTYGYLQADLMDYTKFDYQNHRFKYILCVIDVYSRYGWAVPLKNKTNAVVEEVMSKLLLEISKQHKLISITSDNGPEFVSKAMQELFKSFGMDQYTDDPGQHTRTGLVERFNRTIRELIAKFMTQNNTLNWSDHIDKLIENYNSSQHSALKHFGNNVTPHQIWTKNVTTKLEKDRNVPNDIEVGDSVRYRLSKKKFGKVSDPKWSETKHSVTEIYGNEFYLDGMKRTFTRFQLLKTNENKNKTTKTQSIEEMKKELEHKAKANRFLRREGLDVKIE